MGRIVTVARDAIDVLMSSHGASARGLNEGVTPLV